jgi:CheY-like chemotaxis protein
MFRGTREASCALAPLRDDSFPVAAVCQRGTLTLIFTVEKVEHNLANSSDNRPWVGGAMKILLVEDDAPVAEFLAEAFQEAGHQVVIAHSGEEALRALRREPPEVVFLDLILPKMNGIQVLERIRLIDETLPVVIITAYPNLEEVVEARRLGVTEVIEKPDVLKQYTGALARVSRTS